MMDYAAMLDRLEWDFRNGRSEVEKLDRILFSFRRMQANVSKDQAEQSYTAFWKHTATHNVFMSALLYKRAEKAYGSDDLCVRCGKAVITDGLSNGQMNDDWMWRLLAEIEMNWYSHLREYTRYAIDNNVLAKALDYLRFSNHLANSVISFLHSFLTPDAPLRKKAMKILRTQKWRIELSTISDKTKVKEILQAQLQWNDVSALIDMLELCVDLRMSDYLDLSQVEWRDYLLEQYQPISMVLFRKILKREGLAKEDVLRNLYAFTSWQTGKTTHNINNYLFFAYGVCQFPNHFDQFAHLFDADLTGDADSGDQLLDNESHDDLIESIGENSRRYYNHLIVDKPFRALVIQNPDKVPAFLKIVAPVSLYDYSQLMDYKKRLTWVEDSGYFLNDYMNYTNDLIQKHSPADVLSIYMNSPLKSQIDFSYVIRHLYQPKEGFVDLTGELDGYTMCGLLTRKAGGDSKTSYQVTLSNASSTYRFPVHHSWVTLHRNELEERFTDGEMVYFKIMSVNAKGMVFAYDLAQRPKTPRKEIRADDVKSRVVKNLDRLRDGTLATPGNQGEERIRLYVLAMISDDEGRILVGKTVSDKESTEYLPYLAVSSEEGIEGTLSRLLNYYVGFHGDFAVAPCGMKHLCSKVVRNVFFLYNISLASLHEVQKTLIIPKSMLWRKKDEYEANADDYVSQSFLSALQSDWSEQTLFV